MKTLFLFFLLLNVNLVSAQKKVTPSDTDLYNAYLKQDMAVWSDYIHSLDWRQLSIKDKITYLNYSYGYIAYSSSLPEVDSDILNERFFEHINEMSGKMPEAERQTYLCSYYAYSITLHKVRAFTLGTKALKTSEFAVSQDTLNPLALSLRGNVLFYSPSFVGGDKAQALSYLQKAEQQYKSQKLTDNNWNYRALQLTIAQCYEKLGDKQAAIDYCNKILSEEPNFEYISKEYMPYLKGEKSTLSNTSSKIADTILQ